MEKPTDSPTFIDLFAGCGGLSLGLKLAGWRGIFAAERNPMAFESLEANCLGEPARERGIAFDWPSFLPREPIAVEDLLHGRWASEILSLRGQVDLISGGPPCQGFSFSGRRHEQDPRNRLIDSYAELVLRLRPRLLLIENVPGILVPHGKARRGEPGALGPAAPHLSYAERLSNLLAPEYLFVRDTVNSADLGVPQRRKRFFGVGILRECVDHSIVVSSGRICEAVDGVPVASDRLDPFLLLRSLRDQFLGRKGLPIHGVTVAEAIGDFLSYRADGVRACRDPDSPPGFFEIPYCPPPPSKLSSFAALMRRGMNDEVPDSLRLARHSEVIASRFAQILEKCPRGVRLNDRHRDAYSTRKNRIVPLDPNQPSHTVTTLPDDLLHYSEPRILTVRECARLQSFPDWYVLRGKYTTGGDRRRHECPRYTQVGNAVPPLLAEAWGLALRRMLQGLRSPDRNRPVSRA